MKYLNLFEQIELLNEQSHMYRIKILEQDALGGHPFDLEIFG